VYDPGYSLVKGEATRINVPVMQEITSDMDVVIEGMH
jgi:hypothetical protein